MVAALLATLRRKEDRCHPTAVGKCKPFKLYSGIMVTKFGCQGSCKETSIASASLNKCLADCVNAGYSTCRTATYDPTTKTCHTYSERLEDLGAHASAAVHVADGLGVVTASYCEPPAELAKYPDAPSSTFGVQLQMWPCCYSGDQPCNVK